MLRRNVLIFHAGALGDFVLSWPLGLALGRLYPQSRIFFITQRQKGLLAEKVLRLDSMDVESGWHHLFGDAAQLPEVCRKKLEGAHAIFTFLARPGDPWMKAVAGIAPHADIVPVEIRPAENESRHASQLLVESLATRPVVQTAVKQLLTSIATEGVGRLAVARDGPVVIHPGAGSPDKCWPIESYLRLGQLLAREGRASRFVLGEVELERWPAEVVRRIESVAPVAKPTTYLDLLDELAKASAFIGNDSGPGHLAGIIGIPTVVLFGPTQPAVWQPLGPRVSAIHQQPFSALLPEMVLEKLNFHAKTN